MKKYIKETILLVGLYLSCTIAAQAQEAPITLSGSSLKSYGRCAVTENTLTLISSAAHTGFGFKGTSCTVWLSLPSWMSHNYIQYEVDGIYQKRVKITNGASQTLTIEAEDNKYHQVWIYKATEAHTGPVNIDKVVGKQLKTLTKPQLNTIEFIGNSITCGAAADPSDTPCGQGAYHDQHNAYMAYGPRVARALNLGYIVSGVSGIGIYRNWNSDGPAMPMVYENLDFQVNATQKHNFASFTPKIVSIALGTNDFSDGDGKTPRLPFDSVTFVNEYVKFIQKVHQLYPKATLALLSSPMLNGSKRQTLHNCLATIQKTVEKTFPDHLTVHVFYFEPMQPRGCTYHPSVEDHQLLAEQLLPFFRKLL